MTTRPVSVPEGTGTATKWESEPPPRYAGVYLKNFARRHHRQENEPSPMKWSTLSYGFWLEGGRAMPRKQYKPEEIVAKLRQVDVMTAQGQSVAEAIRSIGISEVTYYRWRQEFGGLKSDQV